MHKQNTMDTQFSLQNWYKTPFGSYVFLHESRCLNEFFSPLRINKMLQIGAPNINWLPKVSILRKFFLCTDSQANCLQGQLDKQPFRSESFDLIVVPHTLSKKEVEDETILNEFWRILSPNGHIVFLGFQAGSPLWFCKLFASEGNTTLPSPIHFYNSAKLIRYFFLSGGTIALAESLCYYMPFKNYINESMSQLVEKITPYVWRRGGNTDLLIIKKQTVPLEPIKFRWSLNNLLPSTKENEPSVGRVRRG